MVTRFAAAALVLACLFPLSSSAGERDGVSDLRRDAVAAAERGDGASILHDVRLRYDRLRTFRSNGESVEHAKISGTESDVPTTFTMVLARPDRYRITWHKDASDGPGEWGAAWRTAEGPHAYRTKPPGWALEREDDLALGLGGVPSRHDVGIPSLFFKLKTGFLGDAEKPTIQGSETVEGEKCWIIASRAIGRMDTVWISQDRLIERRRRSVQKLGPDDEAALEKRAAKTRAEWDAMVHSKLGLDAEQSAAFHSTMMDMLRAFAQHAGTLESSTTVTYRDVVLDAPTVPADFEFRVPEGIPRKTSLLGDVFGNSAASARRTLRPAPAGEDASTILAGVVARYRDTQAFAADGTLAASPDGGEGYVRRSFTLALRRPNRYRLSWSRECAVAIEDGVARTVCPPGGTVWNAGDGPYEYYGTSYEKEENDMLALAGALGASGGATNGVPGLFLNGDRYLVDLINPALDGVEVVDGEECWVISGSSRTSAKRTLWISRARSMIVQHRWSNAAPPEFAAGSARAEEDALEHLKANAKPEERDQMALFVDMAKARARHRTLARGDMTATYRNIRVDDAVAASELAFTVPEGTPLGERKRPNWLPGAATPAGSPSSSVPTTEAPVR